MSEYTETQSTKWYALTVRYQHERQIEKALQSKGLETLVPVYRSRRQWSDRAKDVELPLFAGYVLCQFDLTARIQVLDTPGVFKIVGFGGTVAALNDSEVAGIQRAVASKFPLEPWPYLKAGDRVRVDRGPASPIWRRSSSPTKARSWRARRTPTWPTTRASGRGKAGWGSSM